MTNHLKAQEIKASTVWPECWEYLFVPSQVTLDLMILSDMSTKVILEVPSGSEAEKQD